MAKNKIPIWENFKDYPEVYSYIISTLLPISDKEYQLRVWYNAKGPEMHWSDECIDDFDLFNELLKNDLRNKKITLTSIQIKTLLRIHAMMNKFERRDFTEQNKINDFCERQLLVINHPYWDKIRKRAKFALTLFREVPSNIKSCKN
ncbi:MAG: hypothetical protein ABL927_03320 [Bdellovibrionales bacterium]